VLDTAVGAATGAWPVGLTYLPDFITAAEEAELLGHLAELDFRPIVMRGVTANRTAAHFGYRYGYDSWTLEPAPELPAFLSSLRERCASLAGVLPEDFAEVLVARYPPGAGIGWHRDAPLFGPTVVGVSLGAAGTVRFRRTLRGRRETCRLILEARSGYVLAGAVRSSWQHALSPVKALRYSVTFRTVRPPSAG
jgi:alkylated DNA repair dioxygenase AlkB